MARPLSPPRRFWAACASLAAHGAVIGFLLLRFEAAPSQLPPPATIVEFAPAAASLSPATAAEPVEALAAVAPAEAAAMAAAPPEPVAAHAPADPPAEMAEPPAEATEAPAEAVAAADVPDQVVAAESPPPPPPKPRRKPAPPPARKPAASPPPARPAPAPAVVPAPARTLAQAPAAPAPSAAPSAAASVATPQQQAALAPAGPPPSWLAALRGQLERHKVYPSAARSRRLEGTALLRFVIARDGQVVSASIVRSSGVALLDRAASDMVRRAAPLPPIPPEMPNDRFELTVPVSFALR